ncbi:LOW QUALITY PROTEIN: hypothetical protein Syun_004035 [Stephania yunnanensis]|uniref:Uncharacterized protein n=1 Tax=Stephania yunnanensis TaxID=152371 RepID=A0AAP0Q0T3_9MAGN
MLANNTETYFSYAVQHSGKIPITLENKSRVGAPPDHEDHWDTVDGAEVDLPPTPFPAPSTTTSNPAAIFPATSPNDPPFRVVFRDSLRLIFEFGSAVASADNITLAVYCPVSDDLEPCRWEIPAPMILHDLASTAPTFFGLANQSNQTTTPKTQKQIKSASIPPHDFNTVRTQSSVIRRVDDATIGENGIILNM